MIGRCIYRDKLGLLKIGLDKNAPNLGSKNLMDKMTKMKIEKKLKTTNKTKIKR